MLENRRIYLPPVNLIGPGALKELKEDLINSSYKKALFVTDEMLVKIGVAKKLKMFCRLQVFHM